ncbi:MAG: hypothetical protein KDE27_25335, partial [Planctomycetes bacterium]|nr:hypothetical protein [Planctomycetota bacterium]
QFLPVPPLPFVAGTRDLRVELRRGGSVRASVVAGGHIEAFCLQPLLLPADGRFVGPGAGDFDPGRDPRVPRETGFVADDPLELAYVWPAVAPGRYRFELRARGVPRPLRVLDGIEVADGERTVDPRLQHLKVAGLRAIEITLPQADGTPIALGAAAGVVAVLDGDAPGEPCWRVDGPTVFFANDTAIDVLVRLPGCRDRIVRGVDGKQTITLEPGVPVALTLDGYRPPPGGAIRIELEALEDVLASRGPALYSAAAGGALGRYRSLRVGGECTDGGVQLRLPAPGQYRVVARTEAAGGTRTGLAITPSELAVGAAGGEWTVRVDRGR